MGWCRNCSTEKPDKQMSGTTCLQCRVKIAFDVWERQNARLRSAEIQEQAMKTKLEEAYAEYYEFQGEMSPPHIMESAQARISDVGKLLSASQWEVSSASADRLAAQRQYENDYRAWEKGNT